MNQRRQEKGGGNGLSDELAYYCLKEKFGLDKKDIEELIQKKNVEAFPSKILNTNLSSLEAIVKYMREKGYDYRKIGHLLKRNPKTLAVSYSVAQKKRRKPFDETVNDGCIWIPYQAIQSHLSILESICIFLKKDHKNKEIAKIIGLDERTIWTVLSRAKKKVPHG